jgi:hypothetical protein
MLVIDAVALNQRFVESDGEPVHPQFSLSFGVTYQAHDHIVFVDGLALHWDTGRLQVTRMVGDVTYRPANQEHGHQPFIQLRYSADELLFEGIYGRRNRKSSRGT